MTSSFAGRLLAWFDEHGRKDLPWQRAPTPYRVWISEIMLQQTQVMTVIPYFDRFVDCFPDVHTLAAAPLDEVLHLWSGLGYYARARNLHRSARIVTDEFGGVLPDDIDALQRLPGIGRSTAGAILALAHDRRHPILDGNVKRVLCRYHAIDEWPGRPTVEQRLWALAEAATPVQRARDYTQAIMDLGATLCTRARPGCVRCPQADGCAARREGDPSRYPAPKPKAPRPERSATLLLLSDPDRGILLERRPPAGIWGGLWSLPEVPEACRDHDAIRTWCAQALGCRIGALAELPGVRHGFTHFTLAIRPLQAQAAETGTLMEPDRLVWYNDASHAVGIAAPVARLISQWFESREAVDVAQGAMRQAG